jgi:glutamine synthetase type III
MVMQIIEEVATTFGLAALLQEKPFQVSVRGFGAVCGCCLAS